MSMMHAPGDRRLLDPLPDLCGGLLLCVHEALERSDEPWEGGDGGLELCEERTGRLHQNDSLVHSY